MPVILRSIRSTSYSSGLQQANGPAERIRGFTDYYRVSTTLQGSTLYDTICNMKRTTIFVDEALERDLRAIAEREKRTVSELVREALASYVARRKKVGPGVSFVALGRSGHRDTAEKHEELLWQDLPGGAARNDRKRRRAGKRSARSTPASNKRRG